MKQKTIKAWAIVDTREKNLKLEDIEFFYTKKVAQKVKGQAWPWAQERKMIKVVKVEIKIKDYRKKLLK